jgi:branched-chain amino acid transport system substrate-binding protein
MRGLVANLIVAAGFGAAISINFAVIEPGTAQSQSCPIRLGGILPLSGTAAAIGKTIADAAQMAVDDANAAGGVKGCKVEFALRDDLGQPQTGVDAAKQLVDITGVPALVGTVNSSISLSILTSVAVPSHVTMVSCCSASTSFTDLAREGKTQGYWFRTLPTSRTQGYAAAKLAIDHGYKKTAILLINSDFGTTIAREFQSGLERLGGKVVASVQYNENQPSYRAEVNRALADSPDSLFLVGFPVDGATVLREWLQFGGPQEILMANGLRSNDFVKAVGPQYFTHALGVDYGQVSGPSVDAFNDAWKAKFGKPPNGPGIHSMYDAAALVLLAMEASPTVTGTEIRDHLRAVQTPDGTVVGPGPDGLRRGFDLIRQHAPIRYVGAAGPLQFDQAGDVVGPVLVWNIKDGQVAPLTVWPIEEVRALFAKIGG